MCVRSKPHLLRYIKNRAGLVWLCLTSFCLSCISASLTCYWKHTTAVSSGTLARRKSCHDCTAVILKEDLGSPLWQGVGIG